MPKPSYSGREHERRRALGEADELGLPRVRAPRRDGQRPVVALARA